ncbi:shikimate kinase [Stenomitos frigidus ULC18]|uniref:Shikimate kinase n=1 Tax=Stenomitos frigidus ULC18 TaxID=2107698 RepID=A0A2T1EM44_9CYAN|nr:shikimate kinase [Stenomitos frigidus ULC18]
MNDFLKGTNLYLIGMMGAGKTTVGQRLAAELDYRFFDTDAVIEQVTGLPIRELFAQLGEAEFRKLESQVLAELSPYMRLTIATGGGIILKRENWSHLRHGIVVWLDVPVEHLQVRLQADDTRPLLQGTDLTVKLQTLLEERQALYAQADVRICYQAEETLEQLTMRTIEEIKQALKAV